jgi:trans-aconitate methyltransferase
MCFVAIRTALHSALNRRGIDFAARDPWYFPTAEDYSEVIVSAGFKPLSTTLYPRQTPAHSLADWIRTFAGHNLLAGLSEDDEKAIVNEVVQVCEKSYTKDAEGKWPIDYVRLRFVAIKVD